MHTVLNKALFIANLSSAQPRHSVSRIFFVLFYCNFDFVLLIENKSMKKTLQLRIWFYCDRETVIEFI